MTRLEILSLLATASAQAIFNPQYADNGGTSSHSVPLDLSSLFDNRGFAMKPNDADFDGIGSGFPAQYLPPSSFVYDGVDFSFPQYQTSGNDNALATGQTIKVPQGRYSSVHMLAAAETAQATGFINATYSDNTTTSGPVLVDPFWDWPYPYGGDIIFPYYYSNVTTDYNRSMIFFRTNWLDSTKELVSLQLPNVTEGSSNEPGGAGENTRLHIFSVSLLQANGSGPDLSIRYARTTNSWMEGTNKTQIVEATIDNSGDAWILANQSVRVIISSPGLTTVFPGVINRLRPGDRATVQIGVVNTDNTTSGTSGPASILINGTGLTSPTPYTFNATYGITPYVPTYESIYNHESPPWYNDAKFGIFIHWGVYSVPGWGQVPTIHQPCTHNSGKNESYAEWYWYDQNLGPSTPEQTYQYNLLTYGPNHTYDDFIPSFIAEAFNPKDWVDLFASSGAQYFVQVSKHHDGYALFDLPSTVSLRTSVALPPHRNLLQELFDAAATYQPHLHRATYFSLPEWFNPAYAPYGFGSWPGGNATNPYTNETLPYTGFVNVSNYISDVILPSMQTLAAMGTEIMWCDIGGPNLTAEFASEWFNTAALQGRQVVMDNRCGLPGDFDTPEYARYDAVQARKWESNLGMDPFSYGFNRATSEEAYLSPEDIVTSLVDIVSKNGNFLLDIGPMANGSIVDVEQRNLRDAGEWIRGHAEAVFNSSYWFVTPEEGEHVRFLQNQNNFYVVALERPNGSLVLGSPVPWVEGDEVLIVGGSMAGEIVPSRMLGNGSLEIEVPEEVVGADQYAWVFKIGFGGLERGEIGGVGMGSGSGNGTVEISRAGKSLRRCEWILVAVMLLEGLVVL